MENTQPLSVEQLLTIAKYSPNEDERRKAGLTMVARKAGASFDLEKIAMDESYPDAVREEAMKKNTDYHVLQGDYKALLTISKNLPKAIRARVLARVSEAGEKAIENMTYASISGSVYHYSPFGKLEALVSNDCLPESVRRKAVAKAVGIYTQHRDHFRLNCITVTKKLPEDLRKKAGEEMIELSVQEGCYSHLFEIAKSRKFPKETRKLAKERIEEAALQMIERYAPGETYEPLEYLIQNKKLPEAVRQKAKEQVNIIRERRLERLVCEGNYSALQYMAKEEKWPEEFRRKAETAYRQILLKILNEESPLCSYRWERMACDTALPDEIRAKARGRLESLAQGLAEKLSPE